MIQDLEELLGRDDTQAIPAAVLGRIKEVFRAYQHSLEACANQAEAAYGNALNELKRELDTATQRRLVLEMELANSKISDSKEQSAPPTTSSPDLVQTPKARSILRYKLKMAKSRIAELEKCNRHIATQLSSALETGKIDDTPVRNELLDLLKQAATHYEDPLAVKLQQRIAELERNEDILKAEVFEKANEVYKLKKDNAELLADSGIKTQFKDRYIDLHDKYIRNILEFRRADGRVEARTRGIGDKLEEIYSFLSKQPGKGDEKLNMSASSGALLKKLKNNVVGLMKDLDRVKQLSTDLAVIVKSARFGIPTDIAVKENESLREEKEELKRSVECMNCELEAAVSAQNQMKMEIDRMQRMLAERNGLEGDIPRLIEENNRMHQMLYKMEEKGYKIDSNLENCNDSGLAIELERKEAIIDGQNRLISKYRELKAHLENRLGA